MSDNTFTAPAHYRLPRPDHRAEMAEILGREQDIQNK
jgi:hypothetical protein